jgi:hypothetical protein
MKGDLALGFEKFIEQKWQDALNVAAAEPPSWSSEKEKGSASRGVPKATGAVNVVKQEAIPRLPSPSWDVSLGKRCRARFLVGCDGDHVLLQCDKLLGLELSERKMLKKSGLCLFCFRHAAETKCYGKGGFSKPACQQPGCNGGHAASVHEVLEGDCKAVNVIVEDAYESVEDAYESEEDEDGEEWWVGIVRVENAEEDSQEDEPGNQWSAPIPPLYDWLGGNEWHSPEPPPEPSSSEDEEEICYLTEIVGSEPQEVKTEEVEPQRAPDRGGLPREKNGRRRKLRKRAAEVKDYELEMARQDAWLREMLTDSSGSESEEDCVRFTESGRWIAEMTGTQNGFDDDPKRGVFPTEEAGFLKSS